VIRTGMIAFMEGAMIHGIFHGDLHGGNLFVMADGRTALLDFGITARLSPARRIAFLRLMMSGIANDPRGQLVALRDLGALPPDTDIEAVAKDLRFDEPVVDPTTLSGEQLVAEVQRVVKALLGYGARMPKELMLYVKNLVFLDGAIATLAPDLDLFAELADITTYFAVHHGEQIAADVGVAVDAWEMDLTGIKLRGHRTLILLDASASMLDETLVNVLRMRNMDVASQRAACPASTRSRRCSSRPIQLSHSLIALPLL